MKICFHTNFEISQDYVGGTERFLIKLSKELTVLGHEPFIICSSPIKKSYVEGIPVYGVIPEYIQDRFGKYSFFSSEFIKKEIIQDGCGSEALKRLSKYTEEQVSGVDADIIHFNSFAATSFLKPAKNYIVTNHENQQEYDAYWGMGFFKFLAKSIKNRETELHKYPRLITPSFFYANEYTKMFNAPVTGINLGINLHDFLFESYEDDEKCEIFDNRDGIIILLPSRFQIKQKGHDTALKACQILKKKNISFKMIFTGLKKSCEKYLPEFEKNAKELGVEDCIRIKKYFDIRKAYKICDIVISPEKYCSYGLSISESLSLGIPTILNSIPTYKEIASGFEHAIFFEKDSPEDMAEKIIRLIENSNFKRNRNEAIKFRRKNDLRICANKYVDIYEEIINN